MWVVADLDDEYIAKMEDVLEVYERPYNPQEPVICVDEKPITLHADVRPASPALPGREARRDNEYERCGTANVFCAVEPKAGRHFTFATPDRSGFEFAQVAATLAMAYPETDTIHLVLDNLNIHRRKSLVDAFGAEMAAEVWDRFTVHYTPTHGSWLNQAEIEIGIFSRQCLGHRRIPDLKTLRQQARAWNRRTNRNRTKIAWKFDRKTARRKFGYKPKLFKRSKTYHQVVVLATRRSRRERDQLRDHDIVARRAQFANIGGNYERLAPLGDIGTPLYGIPEGGPLKMEYRGLPLDEIEDLLPRSSAYRQAARILFPEPAAFKGRPLTPLHGGHVALCAVSGMLNGIFGSGQDLHVAAWQAVKVVDRSEETEEDGTIVQRERERFTNELTLVYASGEKAILR